jgi:hypothetical protein
MILGVIALGYFAITDRDRITATRLVFDEDTNPASTGDRSDR